MPKNKTKYSVVLPAAGIGTRMQNSLPKQYISLLGKPIIEHTIRALLAHPQIEDVVVVLSQDDKIFDTLSVARDARVKSCLGGKERADSVLAGLKAVDQAEVWVLVHDAARPCLTVSDIDKLLAITQDGNVGGILAVPVKDTMKRTSSDKRVLHTESRANLWHALTPQLFPRQHLLDALQIALDQQAEITDEASAMEFVGKSVKIVEGKPSNLKVTQPDDLLLAEFYLRSGKSHDN